MTDAPRMLSEPESYALLNDYRIPVPRHAVVHSADVAITAAETVGYPCVAKVLSPSITHKSDAGGVQIGIHNPAELRAAIETIQSTIHERAPDAEITGFVIEEQAPPGLELYIGGKRDPAFGPVITFGTGGTLVELEHDITMRVAPVTPEEATAMVRSIRHYPQIAGYRGTEPLDESALADTIHKISTLFINRPEVAELDINPLILYPDGLCAVDARILIRPYAPAPVTSRPPLPQDLFWVSRIALVGASANPEKIGYIVLRNLLSFTGTVYPVNPKGGEILGKSVYPSLADIPERPDAVIITVPSTIVPQVMRDAGERGIPLAVIITSGFRETGEDGARLEEEIEGIALEYGIRYTGPNCLGMQVPRLSLNATFDPKSPRVGHTAFISQSGAIITTLVDWSLTEGIGFSAVFSVGNQTNIDFVDYIRLAAADDYTRTIVLYIEEIRDGRRFFEEAAKVTPVKPVIAIKAGRSEVGQKAAASHTGSLAGSYEVYEAAFRQAGIINAQNLSDAFSLAMLLGSEGYPKGNRAVVISSAGGFCVLASDYAEQHGIRIAPLSDTLLEEMNAFMPHGWSRQNPIDMVGDAGVHRFALTFDALIRHQDEWDIAFVISVPTATLDPVHLATEMARFSRHTEKMVVGCLLGGESMAAGVRILRDADIPNFAEPEDAFRAAGTAVKREDELEKEKK
ncbi:acetate--CoA ligase family protein [Methanogenium organophilum]|uniref:acetate--CoA ligase (ADP-forming) n=1 Tax=Methanogenium organophilum TaxID=2199 RepID=A0A9X9S440_METOG|nr:acetate--CoA ligase family protein [Methanogenium organophilum]WAI01382.1 acetate--CoA ligase family protein [Methanogenium organophilum]